MDWSLPCRESCSKLRRRRASGGGQKVEEAVREALNSIDDVRNSSVREIEELFQPVWRR